jgi:hypothetical protein
MSESHDPVRLDRREAIKWMLAASASVALLERRGLSTEESAAAGANPASGYGTDPDLLKEYKPGDVWPLTFTAAQRRTAAALCDLIIPADDQSPAASSLGVPDFIDEWISAPYPGHEKDRATVVDGLAWLEAEAQRRFGRNFTDLVPVQTFAICDDICHVPDAKPGLKKAAEFFKKFRELTAGGFYTTKEGTKDIGYVGNVPLTAFDGPPPEVLKKLGLA